MILIARQPILKDYLYYGKEILVSEATSILAQLMATIEDRRASPPPNSYTAKLMEGGISKIRAKLIEEAAEVFEAAAEPGDEGKAHLLYEAGDLIYHLFVLLGQREISFAELEAELARRFNVSGLDEKASRKN